MPSKYSRVIVYNDSEDEEEQKEADLVETQAKMVLGQIYRTIVLTPAEEIADGCSSAVMRLQQIYSLNLPEPLRAVVRPGAVELQDEPGLIADVDLVETNLNQSELLRNGVVEL